jgi:hypothetical protein
MASQFHRFDGMSIFDDKGEVKRLIEQVLHELDSKVIIERMRKLDFSYVFIFSKKERKKEIELSRSEIESSWEWRKGKIDETLQKKIKDILSELE